MLAPNAPRFSRNEKEVLTAFSVAFSLSGRPCADPAPVENANREIGAHMGRGKERVSSGEEPLMDLPAGRRLWFGTDSFPPFAYKRGIRADHEAGRHGLGLGGACSGGMRRNRRGPEAEPPEIRAP